MTNFCFICNELSTENTTVEVSRGMPNLIAASVARGDDFAVFLRSQKSVKIHVDCRKAYTLPFDGYNESTKNIKAAE